MAIKFIIIDLIRNGLVVGNQSSSGDTMPPNTSERGYVQANDALLAELRTKQSQMQSDGRDKGVRWNGTKLVVPSDSRPQFTMTVNRAEDGRENAILIDADRTDSVTLTVNANNTSVNGIHVLWMESESECMIAMKFDFTKGVATRPFRINRGRGGRYRFRSTNEQKIITPVNFLGTD